jgi:phage protein U
MADLRPARFFESGGSNHVPAAQAKVGGSAKQVLIIGADFPKTILGGAGQMDRIARAKMHRFRKMLIDFAQFGQNRR